MTATAYETLRREAQRRIEERKLDPELDAGAVTAVIERTVAEWGGATSAGREALSDPAAMANRIVRSISEHGPLTDLLGRSDVEEVFIEGDVVTYLAGDGRLRTIAEPTS